MFLAVRHVDTSFVADVIEDHDSIAVAMSGYHNETVFFCRTDHVWGLTIEGVCYTGEARKISDTLIDYSERAEFIAAVRSAIANAATDSDTEPRYSPSEVNNEG